jgi:anti-sigma regulatory factor (Ser/Thr protein kinase)
MAARTEVRITLPSDPALLAVIRHSVEAFCHLTGGDEATCEQIGLAVDEALTNVIRHGYDYRNDELIELTMSRRASTVVFRIEDRARQVPLESIVPRDLSDIRPGGLGVHLIREVMDEARWSHREGGGMRLDMNKKLVGAEPRLLETNDA